MVRDDSIERGRDSNEVDERGQATVTATEPYADRKARAPAVDELSATNPGQSSLDRSVM